VSNTRCSTGVSKLVLWTSQWSILDGGHNQGKSKQLNLAENNTNTCSALRDFVNILYRCTGYHQQLFLNLGKYSLLWLAKTTNETKLQQKMKKELLLLI